MSSLETWRQEQTDFALVSKEGVELHCHKAWLVENSEYFKAMLSHRVRETDENQMVVPDYDAVTVASFLEWIYAPKLGEDTVKKLKQVTVDTSLFPIRPGYVIYTFLDRNFRQKLSPQGQRILLNDQWETQSAWVLALL